MKKINIFYILFAITVISSLTYVGCSEVENNLVPAPELNIVHPSGWADTTSANFHGKYIYNTNAWNLKQCQNCHGSDYTGGNTGSSCLTCHTAPGGPQNCRLCHGGNSGHANPPKALNGETSVSSLGVGVHVYHLDSTKYSAQLECSDCHSSVSSFDDPNHLGENPDGIADINFGELSKTITSYPGGQFTPDPQWNRATATCSNSYCHGNFKSGNTDAAAVWTDPNSVKCGSCHGNPVTGNPNPIPNGNYFNPHYSNFTVNTCYQCHGGVINESGTITAPEKHVNGVVNFNVE
jgi:predicted CxxxxCH...CXXCH cytochrome family protein